MYEIYCVEDDSNIKELIVYTLGVTGFQARGLNDGKELFEALSDSGRSLPDLILLDIMLPGEDGISILRRLKENSRFRDIPIIMLTAKGAEYDKVLALDLGADDYVTKPFGMMELVSRIKAVLRRASSYSKDDTVRFGRLEISEKKRSVLADGEQIVLTNKEFELLSRLVRNPGIVLTREELLDEIWGHDFSGESRTLDVHIATLRQKLGAAGEVIETIRGVGYRLRER
ncbi:MAG: response regulator transcription factor [Lachnospiraceae bacterium]|nr:response regulator transcription factor [Lachnospiraceae bacterium]